MSAPGSMILTLFSAENSMLPKWFKHKSVKSKLCPGGAMELTISNLLKSFEKGKLSRRELVQALTLLAGTAATGVAEAAAPLPATSVNHIAITVSDVPKASAWYKELFGLN